MEVVAPPTENHSDLVKSRDRLSAEEVQCAEILLCLFGTL